MSFQAGYQTWTAPSADHPQPQRLFDLSAYHKPRNGACFNCDAELTKAAIATSLSKIARLTSRSMQWLWLPIITVQPRLQRTQAESVNKTKLGIYISRQKYMIKNRVFVPKTHTGALIALINQTRKAPGLTLVPWQSGRCLTRDATVVDTFVSSYVASTSSTPGAAAEAAATRKLSKYSTISQTHFHSGCFGNHGTYQRRMSTLLVRT